VDPDESFRAHGADYKCGWTPYEGETLYGAVKDVYVDGLPVIVDGRPTADRRPGAPLVFHPVSR
jgi:dihydroorotase-like cyclic amidohydrolase